MVVFKLLDVTLDLVDGLALSDDKALAVTHLSLDGIKEQVMALFLLGFDG